MKTKTGRRNDEIMIDKKKNRLKTKTEPRISQIIFVMSDGTIQVIGKNDLSDFYMALDRERKLRIRKNIEAEIYKMS